MSVPSGWVGFDDDDAEGNPPGMPSAGTGASNPPAAMARGTPLTDSYLAGPFARSSGSHQSDMWHRPPSTAAPPRHSSSSSASGGSSSNPFAGLGKAVSHNAKDIGKAVTHNPVVDGVGKTVNHMGALLFPTFGGLGGSGHSSSSHAPPGVPRRPAVPPAPPTRVTDPFVNLKVFPGASVATEPMAAHRVPPQAPRRAPPPPPPPSSAAQSSSALFPSPAVPHSASMPTFASPAAPPLNSLPTFPADAAGTAAAAGAPPIDVNDLIELVNPPAPPPALAPLPPEDPLPPPPPPPPSYSSLFPEVALSMPRSLALERDSAGASSNADTPSAVSGSYQLPLEAPPAGAAAARHRRGVSSLQGGSSNLGTQSNLHPSMFDGPLKAPPSYSTPVSHADHQYCVDVRLPPLHPKDASSLFALASCSANLFALPGKRSSNILQWSNADRELVVPLSCMRSHEEDFDAAPCGLVPLPDEVKSEILSVCVDQRAGIMWTGHDNGCVCRWSCSAGRAARYEQHWQAHKMGGVIGMTVTAWGDLWTTSTTGNVHMWAFPIGVFDATPQKPVRVAVSQRPMKPLYKDSKSSSSGHHRSTHIAASHGGRVVWSGGRRHFSLWAAHNGEYLGSFPTRNDRQVSNKEDSDSDVEESHSCIDIDRGLDVQSVMGQFQSRKILYQSLAREEEVEAQQQAGAKGLFSAAAHFAVRKVAKHLPSPMHDAVQAALLSNKVTQGLATTHQQRGNIRVIAASLDGCMVVGYKTGTIQKFTELGRLLWSTTLSCEALGGGPICRVTCVLCVGNTVWVGHLQGFVQILSSATGEKLYEWAAHHSGVTSLAVVGPVVYSLCDNGSIRGWSNLPMPESCIAAWKEGLLPVLRCHKLRVLTGSWNVNTSRPSSRSLRCWLGDRAQSEAADLVIVALQEVEMGASSVAVDYLFHQRREKGNHNAKWWCNELLEALNPGQYARVALRQMSGMLILIFCRNDLYNHVGEIATSSVACGVMGVGGNKGGVAISLTVHRRRVVAVCSHFAAHQERVDDRNADYAKVVRHLKFANAAMLRQVAELSKDPDKDSDKVETADGGMLVAADGGGVDIIADDEEALQSGALSDSDMDFSEGPRDGSSLKHGVTSGDDTGNDTPEEAASADDNVGGGSGGAGAAASSVSVVRRRRKGFTKAHRKLSKAASSEKRRATILPLMGPGLQDAELLVWAGDFNYRIELDYDSVVQKIRHRQFEELYELDQCRREMERGHVFVGLKEAPITFPPTYKFDKHVTTHELTGHLLPYDSSEKRRVPAWTDRVFFRGSMAGFDEMPQEAVSVSYRGPEAYGAVLEACDSDHKPVFLLLDVDLPGYIQDMKRKMCFDVFLSSASLVKEQSLAASRSTQLELSEASTTLRAGDPRPRIVTVSNKTGSVRVMLLGCDGSSSWHLPTWLEMSPVTAILGPGECVGVAMRAVQPDKTTLRDDPGSSNKVQASALYFESTPGRPSVAMIRVYSLAAGVECINFRQPQQATGVSMPHLKVTVMP